MAAKSVNTTASELFDANGGMKSVLVQNTGTGGLWVDVIYGPNGTVTSSTGVYIGVGETAPIDVYQGRLLAISNGTSDVRYC
jgi:hypothetical protein